MRSFIKLKKKHFLILILFILLISILSFFTTYTSIYSSINQTTINSIKTDLDEKINTLNDFIHTSERLVLTLAKQKLLQDALRHGISAEARFALEQEYQAITDFHHIIMQLRFLDKNGKEVIRIDREMQKSAKAHAIPIKDLQDKKNRYYFDDASKLQEGETWVSDIDLNIEHGSIERPYKPTVRVATAVYTQGRFNGVIIVNLHLKAFLEQLRKSSNYDLLMVDAKGNIILHKDPQYDWAKYLNTSLTLDTVYNKEAQNILDHEEYSTTSFYSRKLHLKDTNQTYTIIINEIKDTAHFKNIKEAIKESVPIFIIIVVVVFLLLSFFIIKEVKTFNDALQDTVDSQINQLSLKDGMLIKQSRHAAMGEMLSIIAHQWRQPLSVISSITANLNMQMMLEKASQEMIQKSLQDIETQVEYLSHTITDFRDFFRPNKDKKECDLKQLLVKCKTLVTNIESDNINLTIDAAENIMIYTYANELQQIILSIINNAVDAIRSHKVEEGKITIKVMQADQSVTIRICDNGGGISKKIMQKIWEPYYSTKGENGTGLGLYMSDIIMQMHLKGKISVFNIDQGACFELLLNTESH